MLDNGTISEIGTYNELISHDGAFAEFIRTYLTEEAMREELDSEGIKHEEDNILKMKLIS